MQRDGGKELHQRYLITDIGCIMAGPVSMKVCQGSIFELISA